MNSEWFFLKEAHSLSGLPNDDIPEFIFWGRSNVGKSSLINLLTKKNLAKTSKTPGSPTNIRKTKRRLCLSDKLCKNKDKVHTVKECTNGHQRNEKQEKWVTV